MPSPFHPTNWSQACVSWIHEIQIAFDPPVPVEPGKGGFLRLMRWSTPRVATLVLLSFTLHCTRPPGSLPQASTGPRLGTNAVDAKAYMEEGVASWYGGDDDAPPVWVALLVGGPASVLGMMPAVAAIAFGRRARRSGAD